MARRAPLFALLFALTLPVAASAADPPEVVAARAAYDRGVALFEAKDWAGAARAFAEADATVRNDVALGAAIDAAIRADDPILGMELVERAEGRPNVANLADARAKFGRRVGAVRVTCAGCSAKLDGAPLVIGARRIVAPGAHALVLEQDGKREGREVIVGPEQTSEIVWAPPVAPAPEAPPRAPGLSPTWFWIGAGATVALAGVTTWSALSVRADHADFEERGCSRVETAGCRDLADRGARGQVVTNVLLGASILSAATTTVLGVYLVRWSVARTDGGAVASLHLRF